MLAFEFAAGLRVVDIQEGLKRNGMKSSGNKGDIVRRASDAATFGTLPKCDACDCNMEVDYACDFGHSGQGLWHCRG